MNIALIEGVMGCSYINKVILFNAGARANFHYQLKDREHTENSIMSLLKRRRSSDLDGQDAGRDGGRTRE